MNQSLPFSPLSTNDQRKQALAKVYALLIKLADDAEQRARPSVINSNEAKVTETTSAPLQQNIPPTEV